jgi:hypothetical protein
MVVPMIDKQFIVTGIETAPYLFISGGIGIIGIASYLSKYSGNYNPGF